MLEVPERRGVDRRTQPGRHGASGSARGPTTPRGPRGAPHPHLRIGNCIAMLGPIPGAQAEATVWCRLVGRVVSGLTLGCGRECGIANRAADALALREGDRERLLSLTRSSSVRWPSPESVETSNWWILVLMLRSSGRARRRFGGRRPQPGSGLAVGHPQRLGLDRGEDGATLLARLPRSSRSPYRWWRLWIPVWSVVTRPWVEGPYGGEVTTSAAGPVTRARPRPRHHRTGGGGGRAGRAVESPPLVDVVFADLTEAADGEGVDGRLGMIAARALRGGGI